MAIYKGMRGASGKIFKKIIAKSDRRVLWSAGSSVTYIVDVDTSYIEEVESGTSCLEPKTFTPFKEGWEFLGWREDTVASADVLSHKLMGDDAVTLYAVYRKAVSLSYNGNGAQSGSVASQSGTAYYNGAGNTEDVTFTLAGNGFARSDYNFTGWDLGAAGASITLSEDTVVYAQWERIPAEAFYLYVDTLGLSVSYTEVKNGEIVGGYYPGSGNPYWAVRVSHNGGIAYSYATQEITGVKRNHCTKVKFQCFISDTDNGKINIGGISHNIVGGENIVDISSLTEDVINVSLHTGSSPNEHGVQITAPYFYGEDVPTEYTVTYVVDEGVSYQEDVAAGVSCLNPTSFTPSKEGLEFIGWKDTTNADGNVLSSKTMGNEAVTLYAVYKQTITETFVDYDGAKNNTYPVSSTSYYNAGGNAVYGTITAPEAAYWQWMTFEGWAAPNDRTITVDAKAGDIWKATTSCERFAIYSTPVTVAYNGNGATSGSVASQSGTQYCNVAGGWSYPSIMIAKNGFAKTGYSFKGWTDGANTYAEGQTITATSNMTLSAVWEADVVAEPYSVNITRSLFTTEGDFEDYYSDITVYEGQVAIWEFANEGGGIGTITAYGLETKGCNKVKVNVPYPPSMSTYTLVGATNVSKNGTYLYGTVSGDAVDIGISVTMPPDADVSEGFDSLTIEEISFYSE